MSIQATVDLIAGVITGLSVSFTADGTTYTETLSAYTWAPRDVDPPCAVVEMPELGRVGVDEPESQFGSRDFDLAFPVVFYFDLDDPQRSQSLAVASIEAFVNAIDAAPTMGDASILDSKVVSSGPPEIDSEQQRGQIVYPCRLELRKFVS